MSPRRLSTVAALVLASCVLHSPSGTGLPPPTLDPALAQAEFALGPGDTFDVRVVGEAELTGSYRVGPDGSIDFPYIGQLLVEGMLPHALGETIANRLKQGYMRSPQVTVTIKDQVSKRITIVGQVAKNGIYSFTNNMTILEAISGAGGFTPMAAKNDTTVTRLLEGRPQVIKVPVGDITNGSVPDFPLRPGDMIAVPERYF